MVDLGIDGVKYKITEATQTSLDDCYCCGIPAIIQVVAIGFPGAAKIGLCWNCQNGRFERVNGFLQFVCPFCGSPNIADMVYYWKSIDIFNEKTGQKKRGKSAGRKGEWKKVDWKQETEKLRQEYKECNIL